MPEQLSLLPAVADFQADIRAFSAASTELERAAAAHELERTRGVLILDYGFTLEQVCKAVDGAA